MPDDIAVNSIVYTIVTPLELMRDSSVFASGSGALRQIIRHGLLALEGTHVILNSIRENHVSRLEHCETSLRRQGLSQEDFEFFTDEKRDTLERIVDTNKKLEILERVIDAFNYGRDSVSP